MRGIFKKYFELNIFDLHNKLAPNAYESSFIILFSSQLIWLKSALMRIYVSISNHTQCACEK